MKKSDLIKSIQKNLFFAPIFFKHYFTPPKKCLAEKNLYHWDMHVLLFLMENGRSTMTEISMAMNIPKPNMTGIINRLIKEDCVERTYDPGDRRVIYIDLTKNGLVVLEKGKDEILKSIKNRFENYPVEWLTQVSEVLAKIREIVEKDPNYIELMSKKKC